MNNKWLQMSRLIFRMRTQSVRGGSVGMAQALFLLFVSLIFFSAQIAHAQTIRMGGTGSGLGIVHRLAESYRNRAPDVDILILPSIGSRGAIQAVTENALDIGVISRPLKADEGRDDLVVVPLGKTPFIFITEKNVGAENLHLDELVAIYQGEMKNWPNGQPIRIVLRPAADTDTQIVRRLSSEMRWAMDAALSRPGMRMARTNQEALAMIAGTPGSLGTATLAQVLTEGRAVSMPGYNGVRPTVDNQMNGTYPISLPHSLVTKSAHAPVVSAYLDFVRSPEGRAILIESGLAPTSSKVD